jgi:hypothetical protein
MFGTRNHHDDLERGTTTISRSRNTANIDAARKLHDTGQGLGSFELFQSIDQEQLGMRSCDSRKLRGAATIYCAIWRLKTARESPIF